MYWICFAIQWNQMSEQTIANNQTEKEMPLTDNLWLIIKWEDICHLKDNIRAKISFIYIKGNKTE